MAIRGSLKEASLPDVLQLVAMGKKTGCLSVAHRTNFGYIYFDKGRISYASIVNRRDRLGDMLLKTGVITREQLDNAIAAQGRRNNLRLGELLVEQGALSAEDLNRAIRVQIEEAVYHLFTWKQGTFNFEADATPDQDFLVSINPESLLLEGARRVDEWGLMENKIPTFDIVFELDLQKVREMDAEVSAEQRVVMELVDGSRDVQEIVEASGLVEFEVAKALYGLLNAGFIHRIGKSAAPSTAPLAEARIDEHRNLGIAFYKTGMLDEALREFRRVLDLRGSDVQARFYVGLVLARQRKWSEATSAFTDASRYAGAKHAVFHNLAYVLEQQGRYAEAQTALEEAVRRGGEQDPRVHTSLGVVYLLSGDLAAAESAFAAALPLFANRPPTAAWYHYVGLTTALLGEPARAATILAEGTHAHPHASALANNYAAVLERRGQYDEARAMAERAVLEDTTLPQLQKNLGDLYYRLGRYDDALEAYLRATKANPDLGDDVYLKLGNIRLRRRERDEAIRCWERALELDPDNAIVRTNLESVGQVL
jgi:tetratricopeptide (TPR) repeat protein